MNRNLRFKNKIVILDDLEKDNSKPWLLLGGRPATLLPKELRISAFFIGFDKTIPAIGEPLHLDGNAIHGFVQVFLFLYGTIIRNPLLNEKLFHIGEFFQKGFWVG